MGAQDQDAREAGMIAIGAALGLAGTACLLRLLWLMDSGLRRSVREAVAEIESLYGGGE